MRLLLVLAGLSVLTACAASPRPPGGQPEALVIAFVDDFHSGVILDRDAVPAGLLPLGGRSVPAARWVGLHYGERRWIRGEADGMLDALRLAVLSGEGGVQMDLVPWWRHDRGGTEPSRVRLWAFPATQAEVAGVVGRLDSWIADGGAMEVLAVDSGWWRSSRAWTLTNNCHDFTVDLLAGAGLELSRPPVIQAEGLRVGLDRAWAERAAGP